MATIRVHKTKNYTVMSNTHLRDKELSLKAKGLLSVMLSLPDNWDYSIAGLVAICKENETAVKSALNELKDNNYVVVIKENPTKSNGGRIKYTYEVYEEPHKQKVEKQPIENLGVECQQVENHGQLNTNRLSIDELNTDIQNTDRLNTNKKDNTSTNIDVEVHTSVSEKQTARVATRDEMLLKEKDMVNRFNNICDNDIDNSAICDCVKDGFKMYMQLYEIYFHKVHPILTDKTLKNVCFVLSTITDTEHGHFDADAIYETDDKEFTVLQRMINGHFIREHRESTNYSITHFANAEYLGKLANRFIEM